MTPTKAEEPLYAAPQQVQPEREPLSDEQVLRISRRALGKCTGTEEQHLYIARKVEGAAMLAAAPTPPAPEAQRREPQWQPVETLPDDTLAILHGAKRSEMVIGMRHSRDGWVIDAPSEWASMYPPKHWMPLPAAPGATTGEEPGNV